MDSPFLKGSFAYLGGSVLTSVLPLLLLPVLTRYLSPGDYGLMATSAVLTQILVVFIGVNAFGLLARCHFDEHPGNLRDLLSTAMALSGGVAVLLLGFFLAFGRTIERLTEFPAAWLGAVFFIAWGTVIQNNYLSLLQARSEPLRYISIQFVGSLLNLGISLLLVVSWHMDWRGEGDRLPRVSRPHGRSGASLGQSLACAAHDARNGGGAGLSFRECGQHITSAERMAV